MKIAFLLNSVSRKSGGLLEICRRLAQTIAKNDEVFVLGVSDEFSDRDFLEWQPVKPMIFSKSTPAGFAFARGYSNALRKLNPDIVHVHALWIYPSLVGYRWYRRTKRPLIYSAHGMLDQWALRNSGWKKRIVRLLWEDAAHHSANCFHVNSEAEYQSARQFGLRNPICIIPNGIDLPQQRANRPAPWGNTVKNRHALLYLGRLHPKKNLSALLKAWKEVQRDRKSASDWVLAIAGWDQGGYQQQLEREKEKLEISDSVMFLGPLFGEDKAAAYANAAAFVTPSLSEGMPMVVLEAWAYRKPALMTSECNLPEGFMANAALRIGTTPSEITKGLIELMDMSEVERISMGQRGRDLVTEKFAWSQIGEQMRAVYKWTLGGGAAPPSVRFD